MKVRVKYAKTGPLKFISHLDVMRYFQKSIRRAGLDIAYSTGLSPHEIISFAAPMPLMLTSAGIDLIYVSNGETETTDVASNTKTTASSGDFLIDLMFGVHAEIVPNFILTGKVGLGFDYTYTSTEASNALGSVTVENSRLDFGLKAGVYASWFFM